MFLPITGYSDSYNIENRKDLRNGFNSEALAGNSRQEWHREFEGWFSDFTKGLFIWTPNFPSLAAWKEILQACFKSKSHLWKPLNLHPSNLLSTQDQAKKKSFGRSQLVT